MLTVWDIAGVRTLHPVTGEPAAPTVVARQISEYPVNRMKFNPYPNDKCMLVTVGQSNIRFWRMKNGHLPVSSVPLNEHARQNFTDFAFEAGYGDGDATKKRMYVSTASGAVFQVNMQDRRLEAIFQLHSGPIYSIAINEGFCVTGAGDRYLRVWPLDFSDYYLQAQHPSAVIAGDISPDGLKVAVATEAGCLGVLDLASTQYQTKLRAHTGSVCAMALDPHRDEFATAADDGSNRIWGLASMEQVRSPFCETRSASMI